MGHSEAQVLVGIHRGVVDADFVVEVRPGRASAEADVADGVAAMDVLSGGDGEARKVAEAGGDSVSMVDHNSASVAAQKISERNGAVGRSDHGRADTGGDIDTGVEGAFSIERINALAEGAGDLAFDRPEVRSSVSADPVGSGGVLGEAE